MGGYLSALFGINNPKTPVKGICPRITNIVRCHWKGLIGIFIPLLALPPLSDTKGDTLTLLMWIWMFWSFLWQPFDIPVTATIPIFFLPMTGVMNTLDVCKCYFNENIALYVLSGMLILLMNNSGVDRRIALWLICSGDSCQFSGKRLVFKCSTAAFFLSMFSNRLIVTSAIMQYIAPALTDMHSSRGGSKNDANYQEMRYIINNAIQTSSAIGSTAIVHASTATLLFRGVFVESPKVGEVYEDIFNYMQFSAFAFPVALIQFIINFAYHMVLINNYTGVQMPASSMAELRGVLTKLKSSAPRRVSLHEKLTVFFMLFALIIFFFRWCPWLNMGWAGFNELKAGEASIPIVTDSTVAAIFVVALHMIPKGFGFFQYLSADKKSELPPIKPESAILWWKFVDKNLNYGYIFVLGSGIALCNAVRDSKLDAYVSSGIGKTLFTSYSWEKSVFLVCLISSLLSNVMSGVGMIISIMPIIIHMAAGGTRLKRQEREPAGAADLWPTHSYVGALAVGLCGSYGFMLPFVYTPAYICRHTGKMPMKKMAKYSFLSVVICLLVLWIALLHWAPIIWDSEGKGFNTVAKPAANKP